MEDAPEYEILCSLDGGEITGGIYSDLGKALTKELNGPVAFGMTNHYFVESSWRYSEDKSRRTIKEPKPIEKEPKPIEAEPDAGPITPRQPLMRKMRKGISPVYGLIVVKALSSTVAAYIGTKSLDALIDIAKDRVKEWLKKERPDEQYDVINILGPDGFPVLKIKRQLRPKL
jgi:hypothetical protein